MKSAVEIAKQYIEGCTHKFTLPNGIDGPMEEAPAYVLAKAVIDSDELLREIYRNRERIHVVAQCCENWLSKYADDKKEEEK